MAIEWHGRVHQLVQPLSNLQNKYDPNTLRFLTGQLSLRIVGIDVPWYPAKENADEPLKNPKSELQVFLRTNTWILSSAACVVWLATLRTPFFADSSV
jgi:hypothetical protein